jgi:hypothetical protein
MFRALCAIVRCWKPETVALKEKIFFFSGPRIPNQTPEVLLSYVSKDGREGEEDLSNTRLTGDTSCPPSGIAKMVTKAMVAPVLTDITVRTVGALPK